MVDRIETYDISEFSNGDWSDRKEYEQDDISFRHIDVLHRARPDFVEMGQCGESDYWFFLHQFSDVRFEFYLYFANMWSGDGELSPLQAEPFF